MARARPASATGEPLRPWLLTIVANEARNRRRRPGAAHGAGAAGAAAGGDTDSAEAAGARGARRARRCSPRCRSLRDDDRLVLGCRYLLELAEAETAAALGVARHREVPHVPRAVAPARGGDAVNDLERELRELDVEWPATPDLATAGGAVAPTARLRQTRRERAGAGRSGGTRRRFWPRSGWRARLASRRRARPARRRDARRVARGPLDRAALARPEERRDPREPSPPRATGRRARAGSRRADRPAARRARPRSARRPRHRLRDAAARRLDRDLARLRRPAEAARADVPRERDAFIQKTVGSARRRRAARDRRCARLLDHRLARVRVRGRARRRVRGAAARRTARCSSSATGC